MNTTNDDINKITEQTPTNAAGAADASGDADVFIDDDVLIRMVIMSRVVERFRFLIPSDRVNDPVNEDTLTWLFELDPPRHILLKRRKKELKAMKAAKFNTSNGKKENDDDDDDDRNTQQKQTSAVWGKLREKVQTGVLSNTSPAATATATPWESKTTEDTAQEKEEQERQILPPTSDENANTVPPSSAASTSTNSVAGTSKWRTLKNMPLPSSLVASSRRFAEQENPSNDDQYVVTPNLANIVSEAYVANKKNNQATALQEKQTSLSSSSQKKHSSSSGFKPFLFASRFITSIQDTIRDNLREISSGVKDVADDLKFWDDADDTTEASSKITEGKSAAADVTSNDETSMKPLMSMASNNDEETQENTNAANEDDELRQLARKLWYFCTHLHGDAINGKKINFVATFRDLFEFDSEHFPFTTFKQREILRSFEDEVLVARDELGFELSLAENREAYFGDDFEPLLNCIFGRLQECVGVCYDRVVSCIHQHPKKQNYALSIGESIEKAKTNLSLIFTTVAMILVTLIVIPQLEIPIMYRFQRGIWGAVTGDFQNFCKTNVTDPASCFLIRENLDSVKTTKQVDFFCREFITTMLWNSGGTRGSEDTFYGNVRIGGMLMKSSPRGKSTENTYGGNCKMKSCDELNLTHDLYEFEFGGSFSCAAYDEGPSSIVLIPFNTTAEEAGALARSFQPQYSCSKNTAIEDTAVTIHFAMLQPSNDLLSFTTISFVVPRGGRVVPRTFTAMANLKALNFVMALAIVKIVTFLWMFLNVLLRRSEGKWRLFSLRMVLEYLMTSMCIASWAMMSKLPTAGEIRDLAVESSFLPKNVDVWISQYNDSLDLIGWYVVVFFVYATNIFSDFLSLSVITRLLKVSSKDVVVLCVLFLFLSIGFLSVARILFGATTYEYSIASMSTVEMLKFFIGGVNYNTIASQNPIQGNLFSFACLFFSVILALNLLIAMVTSRLAECSERVNLHLELEQKIIADAANFEGTEQFWFSLRQRSLTLVSVLVDALPFSTSAFKWRLFNKHMTKLFQPYTRQHLPSISALIDHATKLIDFLDQSSPSNMMTPEEESRYNGRNILSPTGHRKVPVWNTALRRGIDTYQCFEDRASWLLLERVILLNSDKNLVRDAALLRVLIEYDAASTDIEKVISYQDAQVDRVLSERETLAHGLSKRHQKYFDDHQFILGQSAAVVHREKNNNNNSTSISRKDKQNNQQAEQDQEELEGTVTEHKIFNLEGKVSSPRSAEHQQHHQHHQQPLLLDTKDPSSSHQSSGQLQQNHVSNTNSTTSNIFHHHALSGANFASQIFADQSHKMVDHEKQKKKIFTGMNVAAHTQRFWINQYIVRQVKRNLYFPFRGLLVLVLYFSFVIVSLMEYKESSTWIAENLAEGLANFPYVQSCDDPDCHSGFTTTKTFNDVMIGIDNDIAQFIDRLWIPKLFAHEKLGVDSSSSSASIFDFPYNASEEKEGYFPVAFDRNIRRVGNVKIRQIVSPKEKCALPSQSVLKATAPNRREFFENTLDCYNTFGKNYEERSILYRRPETTPAFPLESYYYNTDDLCSERITGKFEFYSSGGFCTEIHNQSQMEKVVSEFLVPAARVIVLSATFTTRDRAQLVSPLVQNKNDDDEDNNKRNDLVGIRMIFETAPGNAGGILPFFFLIPSDQPMYDKYSFIGYMNLGVELFIFFVASLRYLYRGLIKNRKIGGFSARHVRHHTPDVPFTSIGCFIAIIILQIIPDLDVVTRKNALLSVLVIQATANMMFYVIFPLAKIISFRAVFIIRSISIAMKIVLVIVPFYVLCALGFTVSGNILFGRNTKDFATFRLSLTSIGRGVMGEWDSSEIFSQRPYTATYFNAAFFAVILVVLSNLLLSLVLMSVDEARAETSVGDFVGMMAEFQNKHVMADEFVSFILAVHLAEHHFLKRFFVWISKSWKEFVKKMKQGCCSLRKSKKENAEINLLKQLYGDENDKNNANDNDDDDDDETNTKEKEETLDKEAEEDFTSSRKQEKEKKQEEEILTKFAMMSPTAKKFELKAKTQKQQLEQLRERMTTPAVRRAEQEWHDLMKLDERGGQLFVTSSGRFVRPIEALQFVFAPFKLHELAESVHLSEVSESFIYSVVLFLARMKLDFQAEFNDQLTFDLAEGSLLLARFREAVQSGLAMRRKKGETAEVENDETEKEKKQEKSNKNDAALSPKVTTLSTPSAAAASSSPSSGPKKEKSTLEEIQADI